MTENNIELGNIKELSKMDKQILRDFYLSFRVSQGNPDTQLLLLMYAAKSYPLELIQDIDGMNNRVYPHVLRLNIPQKEHKKKVYNPDTGNTTVIDFNQAQTSKEGFQRQWEANLVILERVTYDETKPYLGRLASFNQRKAYELNQLTEVELLTQILSNTFFRDILFVNSGREERMLGNDRHESFLKTYMIDGKKTGSTTFDKLYNDMAELLKKLGIYAEPYASTKTIHKNAIQIGIDPHVAEGLLNKFADLKTVWEKKHPISRFFK